jgi:hypothetical protein
MSTSPGGRHAVHHLPVDQHLALGGFFKAGQHPQRGCLATARRPEERREFPRQDCQIKARGGGDCAVAFRHFAQFSNRLTLHRLPGEYLPQHDKS